MAGECVVCGCPRWVYRMRDCAGCDARMQHRVGTASARRDVVKALQAVEARSGRALAERVKQQAIEQRR